MKPNTMRSPSPRQQLLCLEWFLLGMALFMTLTFTTILPDSVIAWTKLLLLIPFGIMGLRLPQRYSTKLVYTAAELSLILLLTSDFGGPPVMMMRLLPQLGLIVVIRSCQLFQTWGRLMVLGAILLLYWFISFFEFDPIIGHIIFQNLSSPELNALPLSQWQINVLKTNALLFFGMVMLFVSLLVNALLSAYRSQQELVVAHEKLRRYAAKIEGQATLQERNRIAREIHDSLGHSLTAQTILLENALLFLPSNTTQAKSYLLSAKDGAYQALREVSRSVSALRTSPREALLPVAIPALVKDICTPVQIVSECKVELPEPLSEDINLALFRIVQEALTNVVKHSQANQVTVKLVAKRDRLHLEVLDNGQGFNPSQNTTGFGLRGMRERATDLGGTCQIWSAPSEGCRISIIVPLPTVVDHPA
ncbi:MAG: sensor histidine kinase [Cyanobacteria bacterium J06636_16]